MTKICKTVIDIRKYYKIHYSYSNASNSKIWPRANTRERSSNISGQMCYSYIHHKRRKIYLVLWGQIGGLHVALKFLHRRPIQRRPKSVTKEMARCISGTLLGLRANQRASRRAPYIRRLRLIRPECASRKCPFDRSSKQEQWLQDISGSIYHSTGRRS